MVSHTRRFGRSWIGYARAACAVGAFAGHSLHMGTVSRAAQQQYETLNIEAETTAASCWLERLKSILALHPRLKAKGVKGDGARGNEQNKHAAITKS